MDLVGSSGNGRERIGDGEAAVIVAVPVHTNLFPRLFYDFFDYEFNEVECAARSGVADCVAQDDRTRAAANGGGVKRDYSGGGGAHGGLGDGQRGEARRNGG